MDWIIICLVVFYMADFHYHSSMISLITRASPASFAIYNCVCMLIYYIVNLVTLSSLSAVLCLIWRWKRSVNFCKRFICINSFSLIFTNCVFKEKTIARRCQNRHKQIFWSQCQNAFQLSWFDSLKGFGFSKEIRISQQSLKCIREGRSPVAINPST